LIDLQALKTFALEKSRIYVLRFQTGISGCQGGENLDCRFWRRAYGERLQMVGVHPEIGIFVQDQGAPKKITGGICLIFRGLLFECNIDIGQKDHLWMDTS